MPDYSLVAEPTLIKVKVAEKLSLNDTKNFQRELGEAIARTTPSTCVLDIDALDFHVLVREGLEVLKGAFAFYKKVGFKKIIMRLPNNTILRMQINKLIKEAGLANVEILSH